MINNKGELKWCGGPAASDRFFKKNYVLLHIAYKEAPAAYLKKVIFWCWLILEKNSFHVELQLYYGQFS